MTNAEVQSYIDEIAPLPLRGNLERDNNWDYGFLIPWYLTQIIAGDKVFIPENFSQGKYKYPTLQNLLAFASHGVQLIKARLLGLWTYYESHRFHVTPGCRVRDKNGTRKIVVATPNPHVVDLVPETLPPRRSGWKKYVYQFPKKTFTANNNSLTITSIEGKNQYFRIQGLPDDFLKLRRFETRNISRGMVEIRDNRGNVIFTQYSPLPILGSYIDCGALQIDYEQIEGYFGPVPTENSCLPRDIKVHIYLTETSQPDIEIWSQTISWVGIILKLQISGNRYTYQTYSSPGGVSGTVLFLTPSQWREYELLWRREQYLLSLPDWEKGDNLIQLRAVQAELREFNTHISRIGSLYGNEIEGYESVFCCTIGEKGSTVFLQQGHTYGLRVDVDNVNTPLELSNLSTLQSSLMYQPINATQI